VNFTDRLDVFAWLCVEDAIRVLMPYLDINGLAELAAYIRPGSGGAWQHCSADVAPKRDLLLADIADRGDELGGWPFLNDRPVCPPYVDLSTFPVD
jgi:hypothetical protein